MNLKLEIIVQIFRKVTKFNEVNILINCILSIFAKEKKTVYNQSNTIKTNQEKNSSKKKPFTLVCV